MVGTVKDQIITGKLALEIKNKKENSFFTDFGYTDRSIDGIEYVQEYDNTYEVQEWITKFKSIRSPVSNWSASTTIRLISTHLAMIFGRSGLRSSNEE